MTTLLLIRLLFAPVALFAAPQEFKLQCDRPGHVYSTEEEVALRVLGAADGESLCVTLADARGKQQSARDLKASGGSISLGRVGPGWYRLTARKADGKETRIDLAVARPRKTSGFRDNSPFGVAGVAKTPQDRKLLAEMGAAWIQFTIPWAWAEPKPGVYWFSPGGVDYGYDDWVSEANKIGIRSAIQFRSTPLWASAGRIGSYKGTERSQMHPPDDEHWDDFEKFIGVVVDRFRPLGVRHYQMWSEAEGSLFQRWATPRFPKVEAYQKMLVHGRAALRKHDPDALLIAPGDILVDFLHVSEDGYTEPEKYLGKPSEYAGRTLAGIGRNTVDIVAGHFYWTDWQSSPKRLWSPEARNPGRGNKTLTEILADAQKIARDRPLWNTEAGYGSARSAETPENLFTSEDEQADLLVRYFLLNLAWGVDKVFWYTWRDSDQTSYGLLRADGTVKPAYVAYRTMTERLEGLRFDRLVVAGPERWIVRFTGSRTALIVWKTSKDDETVRVSVPWSRVRLTTRDGAETAQTAQNGAINVTLRGCEPVYLDEAE